MSPTEYTVQEHIAELHRVAAQVRLAREVSTQPKVAVWLNRLTASLRRPQPEAEIESPTMTHATQPCCPVPGGAT